MISRMNMNNRIDAIVNSIQSNHKKYGGCTIRVGHVNERTAINVLRDGNVIRQIVFNNGELYLCLNLTSSTKYNGICMNSGYDAWQYYTGDLLHVSRKPLRILFGVLHCQRRWRQRKIARSKMLKFLYSDPATIITTYF